MAQQLVLPEIPRKLYVPYQMVGMEEKPKAKESLSFNILHSHGVVHFSDSHREC